MSLIETKNDLYKDLEIDEEYTSSSIDAMIIGETRYLKDLRINLKNVLTSQNLSLKEAYLLSLAVAVNERNELLKKMFTELAVVNGANEAEIAETHACTSLLATNNVFYRFRHFTKDANEKYQTMPAGIKMNIMISPVLGKELFELMSLVISAVNGCEQCVNSHEASVRKLGSSEERIFDAIKLASIIKGTSIVLN